MAPELPDLDVLHEDNHLLAVCKPGGMLVQGDATGDESLFERTREWIRIKFSKPGAVYLGLVHRLDRPASGVVLFARTSKAASRLCEQFRKREPEKVYRLVVHGQPPHSSGALCNLLLPGVQQRPTRIMATAKKKGVVKAELEYKVLASNGSLSHLEVRLITGRKHQIRAQLSHIGCPVVGDFKYGSATRLDDGHSIALHAASLTVIHPTRQEEVQITAPLPLYWP